MEGDEIEEVKASLVASPPRYPQVGKTVEGDEIAKPSGSLAGLFPDTYGKERPWRERPH